MRDDGGSRTVIVPCWTMAELQRRKDMEHETST